jgi:hypothetical protein
VLDVADHWAGLGAGGGRPAKRRSITDSVEKGLGFLGLGVRV